MSRPEKKKILIVDDDYCVRNLCVDVLTAAGYETSEAQNGVEALQSIKEEIFDLVVADVHMPVMDGLAFYKRVINDCEHLKARFLFMTGDLTEDLQRTFSELNLKYLWKPFKIIDLINCVDAMTMIYSSEEIERISFVRQEVRIPLKKECVAATIDGQKIKKAHVINFSENGIGLRYCGAPLIRASTVDVSMIISGTNLERRGDVIWSRPINITNSLAGLRLHEVMPVKVVASFLT